MPAELVSRAVSAAGYLGYQVAAAGCKEKMGSKSAESLACQRRASCAGYQLPVTPR